MKGPLKPKKNRNKEANDAIPPKRGGTIEETYQKIKEMLYLNELTAGQRIIYRDLSKRLGVSITPIIQALNRLEASGFVTCTPNTGYVVNEISETEAIELFEAREALEVYLIPKIINNLQEGNLDSIRAAYQKERQAAGHLSGRRFAFLDAKFHLNLAGFAQNEFILKTLKDIFEKLYLKYRPEFVDQMNLEKALNEHRALFRALRRKDIAAATEAMRKHTESAKQRFLEILHSRRAAFLL